MNKKIIKVVIYGVVIYGIIKAMLYTEEKNLAVWNIICGVIIAYPIQAFVFAVSDCTDNTIWKEQLRMYMRKNIVKKRDLIRISFSYLFRIKIDGKYLLVLNGRGTEKYQPVGGAYKATQTEKLYLKNKFFLSEDNKIPIDYYSKDDYRMFVPAAKLRSFIKRFDKTQGREQVDNLGREFMEEIVAPKILNFKEISYRYCGRHLTGIEYSRHFRCFELLLADIVELIPTMEQEEKIRELMKIQSKDYYFATKEEIEHCGIEEGTKNLKESISDHSFKILEENEQYLTRIRKNRGCYTIKLNMEDAL